MVERTGGKKSYQKVVRIRNKWGEAVKRLIEALRVFDFDVWLVEGDILDISWKE